MYLWEMSYLYIEFCSIIFLEQQHSFHCVEIQLLIDQSENDGYLDCFQSVASIFKKKKLWDLMMPLNECAQ